jgi:hypothetical protein
MNLNRFIVICVASLATLLARADESMKTEFHKVGNSTDGSVIFEAITYDKNFPGHTVDEYKVNCAMQLVSVRWGPAAGSATGINLPGGGGSFITDSTTKKKLLDMACQ